MFAQLNSPIFCREMAGGSRLLHSKQNMSSQSTQQFMIQKVSRVLTNQEDVNHHTYFKTGFSYFITTQLLVS